MLRSLATLQKGQIEPRLRTLFCTEIAYAGREASASPMLGALARQQREQARLVADAFSM